MLTALAIADGAAPPIPHTPAGHVLDSWLKAFNSGTRVDLEGFMKTQDPWQSVDSAIQWRQETGAYDLLAIYTSRPKEVTFRIRGKKSSADEIGRITVTAANPPIVTELGTFNIPPGATYLGFDLDAATRSTVINSSVAKLMGHYVFPEVGEAMALEIAKRAKQGAYAKTDGESLAKSLTADMQKISHDKHLALIFKPFRMSESVPSSTGGRAQPQAKDCAFDKVERLPNNIGYVKIDGFIGSDACADIRVATMSFLKGVDALIFDLRDNYGGGGSDKGPDLVSYLFDKPTHFCDFWDRTTGKTTETWIQPAAPGVRFGRIPVYVLTSRGTFSAAEYFTYNLQALKRATVVGEVTGGGSHLTNTERIDDRFTIRLPYGRPINPITKTDWEGVGIVPDVTVPASEALAAAENLASDELQRR